MRGPCERQSILFNYPSNDDRIPAYHLLRVMRRLVDPVMAALLPPFQEPYSGVRHSRRFNGSVKYYLQRPAKA